MKEINFSLVHDGKKVNGIAKKISNTPEEVYHVVFEDGYENNFFMPFDADQWCENGIGFTSLAEKVGEIIGTAEKNISGVHQIGGKPL